MSLRVAFDTNLLVYADAGDRTPQDADKWLVVLDTIAGHVAAGDELVLPAQTLIEIHDVLCRKRGLSRIEATQRIAEWRDTMEVAGTNEAVLDGAFALSTRHDLRIFDAVILSTAADANCDRLLSEDFQHGFVWRGVVVVNPFA